VVVTAPLPLPVTVGNPVRLANIAPFRKLTIAELAADGGLCHTSTVAEVPAGNRLIIEHVSVLFRTPPTLRISLAALQLRVEPPAYQTIDAMRPEFLGTIESGFSPQIFTVDHNTRVYLDAGETVRFLWCRDRTGPSTTAELAVSGFFQPQ
jgi:hypothetical protein